MLSEVTYGREFNGTKPKLTKIGTVTVTEAFERKVTYETASWYTMVKVEPGVYDVVLHQSPKCVVVKYHGVVTDEHFVNRLLGHTSLAEKRNIGNPMDCGAQMYDYSAAEQFATNPAWELAEDFSVKMVTRHFSDGRAYKSYSLTQEEVN